MSQTDTDSQERDFQDDISILTLTDTPDSERSEVRPRIHTLR
jgi:hypothetical protein